MNSAIQSAGQYSALFILSDAWVVQYTLILNQQVVFCRIIKAFIIPYLLKHTYLVVRCDLFVVRVLMHRLSVSLQSDSRVI